MDFEFSLGRLGKFAVLGALFGAAACSGGGTAGTSPVPNTQFCGNDTQYALARPQSGQSVPSNTVTSVEIVASGDNNQIAQSFQNFNLLFVPTNGFGQTVATGGLSRARDNGGFAPFPTDFYYTGTIGNGGTAALAPGTLYNVYVNAFTSNCTPVGPIGQLGAL